MYSLWISVVSLLDADCTRNAHHDCLKALNASSFAVRFSNHITLVVTVTGVLCAYLKYLREVHNISCHELATIRTSPQQTSTIWQTDQMPSRRDRGTSGKSARRYRLVNQPLSQEDFVNTYKATQFCQRFRLKAFSRLGGFWSLPCHHREETNLVTCERIEDVWCDATGRIGVIWLHLYRPE